MQTAGFVLVGGQSRRMGRDKALLPWDSGVLVQDVAGKVAAVTGSVALVGGSGRYGLLGFDCIADLRPGFGPLAGIEAALASASGDYNLILACDMPGIDSNLLANLLRASRISEAKCVVTVDETGAVHPLCGVYRRSCLPTVRRALDERRLKLMDVVDDLDAEAMSMPGQLLNVNTVEEWEAVHAAIIR